MPPLPPQSLVLEQLQLSVLPAAGVAALVLCLFALLGRWAGALGSACAVVAGFVAANYLFLAPSWNEGRVLPWKQLAEKKPWEWLPRAALVLILVGLASRWLGFILTRVLPERRWWVANVFVWLPRVAAVFTVGGWLVLERWAEEHAWLPWALRAAMILNWVVLDSIARTGPGLLPPTPGFYDELRQPAGEWTGAGGQVAAYLSVILLAASATALYSYWGSPTEVSTILASAMFGVAVAAGVTKTDASGAIPAGVAFVPALMLACKMSTETTVPVASFWLLALAPLALSPFLIPRLARHNGWKTRTARAILVMIPVVVALVLAGQNATLSFGIE
jgi:hypothetical protein